MPQRHFSRLSILLGLSLFAAISLGLSSPSLAADQPNIIPIMFDDLGNADLGYRGSDIKTAAS